MFFLEVHPAYLLSNGTSMMKHNVLCRVAMWHTDGESIICLSSAVLCLWSPPLTAVDFLLTHVIINYSDITTIIFHCYILLSK